NGAMARLKIPVPPATSKTRMSFFKSKLSKTHVKRFSRFNVNDAFAKPVACFLNCSFTIFSCSLPMLLHFFHSTSLHLFVVFYIVKDAFAMPFVCFLICSLTIFSCSLSMLLHSFHSTSLHLLVVLYILTKLSIKKYPFCYGQFDY